MDRAARDFPPGDLRVSDADRDQALSELSEAFQAGRITADEFDERSGRILAARTGRELNAVLADLPREGVTTGRLSTRPTAGPPVRRFGIGAIALAAIAVAVIVGALANGGQHGVMIGHRSGGGGLIVVLVIVFVLLRVARRRRY